MFCLVVAAVGLRMIARARWATDTILLVMVFVSSPFIVMSAHLIGYYDNIIIVMGVASLALLSRGRLWPPAILQAIWLYCELFPSRLCASAFVQLAALIALVLNATEQTPLMDGLKDHFDLSVRLWMYVPTLASAALLIVRDGSRGDL